MFQSTSCRQATPLTLSMPHPPTPPPLWLTGTGWRGDCHVRSGVMGDIVLILTPARTVPLTEGLRPTPLTLKKLNFRLVCVLGRGHGVPGAVEGGSGLLLVNMLLSMFIDVAIFCDVFTHHTVPVGLEAFCWDAG